jgi:hypothetical protein
MHNSVIYDIHLYLFKTLKQVYSGAQGYVNQIWREFEGRVVRVQTQQDRDRFG